MCRTNKVHHLDRNRPVVVSYTTLMVTLLLVCFECCACSKEVSPEVMNILGKLTENISRTHILGKQTEELTQFLVSPGMLCQPGHQGQGQLGCLVPWALLCSPPLDSPLVPQCWSCLWCLWSWASGQWVTCPTIIKCWKKFLCFHIKWRSLTLHHLHVK